MQRALSYIHADLVFHTERHRSRGSRLRAVLYYLISKPVIVQDSIAEHRQIAAPPLATRESAGSILGSRI